MENEPRELIIFPGALGDLLCAAPAFDTLIRSAQGRPVELMARAELARFAVDRMGFARGHSIDRAEVAELFATSSTHPRAAAFFGSFIRICSFFAADDERFRATLTKLAPEVAFYRFRPASDEHIAVAYLREVGINAPTPVPAYLRLQPEDHAEALRLINALELKAGGFVLLFPGSGSREKNWPVDGFIELAERLARLTAPLVVLGPAEAGLEDTFRRRPIATLSGLELGTVAGLAAAAEAFVGNDSGVSHLAAASGARGVVIFGPTAPDRWRPLGMIETLKATRLQNLSSDEVWRALLRLIRNAPAVDAVRRAQ